MHSNTFTFSFIEQVEALLVIEAKGQSITIIGVEIIRLCDLIIRMDNIRYTCVYINV